MAPYAANAVAEINPAKPSRPSVKLMALLDPTIKNIATGMYQIPKSITSGKLGKINSGGFNPYFRIKAAPKAMIV